MAMPLRDNAAPVGDMPTSLKELGPRHPVGFAPLHLGAIIACFEARAMLNFRQLSLAGVRHLGAADSVAARLDTAMPDPFIGTVGDYVSWTFTSKTISVLASCGIRPFGGAAAVAPDELVIAALWLDTLLASGLPTCFCDRLPTRPDVMVSLAPQLDQLPWDNLRDSRFDSSVDRESRARYLAEVLVWGSVPLDLVIFAVSTESARTALVQQARRAGISDARIITRPKWFFGG